MIITDIGDNRNLRNKNICTVQPATQSGFNYCDINLLLCKPFESHSYGNLKKRRFDLIDRMPDAFGKPDDVIFRNHMAVDPDAFPEVMEMGRCVQTGFVSCFLQNRSQHMTRGTFAIRSSH